MNDLWCRKIRQINVQHCLNFVPVKMLMQGSDCIVATPFWSKSKGAIQKQGFVDALQYFLHHLLNQFILEVTDT
jgi:hypothetical protein